MYIYIHVCLVPKLNFINPNSRRSELDYPYKSCTPNWVFGVKNNPDEVSFGLSRRKTFLRQKENERVNVYNRSRSRRRGITRSNTSITLGPAAVLLLFFFFFCIIAFLQIVSVDGQSAVLYIGDGDKLINRRRRRRERLPTTVWLILVLKSNQSYAQQLYYTSSYNIRRIVVLESRQYHLWLSPQYYALKAPLQKDAQRYTVNTMIV